MTEARKDLCHPSLRQNSISKT